MLEKIALNGYWDWKLPGGMWQRKMVPSSYICVGGALFEKKIDLLPSRNKRLFLCFDGVAYLGKVWFNEHKLGEMLPYIPYRFEVSDWIKNGQNCIRVEVEDITASYGPTGGWEDYGGITRDVYLEICDAICIDDLQWIYTLNNSYTLAQCTVNISLNGHVDAGEIQLSMSLSLYNQTVYQANKTVQNLAVSLQEAFQFTIEYPQLWSPDNPVLYDLQVRVSVGESQDREKIGVGFRELKVEGSRLILNGKDIFLKGVARHEMWGDEQGFTLSCDQVEHDLKLIKQLGANFIRLVHYPHSRMTVEVCDRLGLLLTEEPGLWWSDLMDEATTSKALQIMERTILRDRNSPCVLAWLLFNECNFNGMVDYLLQGKALCKRMDPSRLVSAAMAGFDEISKVKEIFDQTGMDFYTYHPYSYEPDLITKSMEILRGKPLIFTEWGGYYIMDNPNLKIWFKKVITRYAHQRDPQPNLAGMAWWQFQDIYQFSRGLPGCIDGLLCDGLVDRHRNKKPFYGYMADIFFAIDNPEPPDYRIVMSNSIAYSEETDSIVALPLTGYQDTLEQEAAWERELRTSKGYYHTLSNPIREYIGPSILHPIETIMGLKVYLSGRPLILTGEFNKITFEYRFAAHKLLFLGQTTFLDGYPIRGRLGEVIANYTIHYEDGTSLVIPLRNGYEMASASMIARNSRINPVAVNTKILMILHIEEDFEVYQIRGLEVTVDKEKMIHRIVFERTDNRFCPLLYGISVWLA